MEYSVSVSPERDAGRALTELLKENRDSQILLLLSGRSTFSLLEYVDVEFLASRT